MILGCHIIIQLLVQLYIYTEKTKLISKGKLVRLDLYKTSTIEVSNHFRKIKEKSHRKWLKLK